MPQHGPIGPVGGGPGGDRSPATALTGHILITGATGFVGQALLERLLSDHPATHLDLVLRPGREHGARERLAELLSRSAFTPWRTRLGDAAADEVRRRVTLLEGDLLTLDETTRGRPAYDVVFHCAGDVDFRAPFDVAYGTNVLGVRRVFDVARRQPVPPHVVHVSTAYVWADRVDIGPETAVPHDLDWREELRRADVRAAATAQLTAVAGLRDGAAGASPTRHGEAEDDHDDHDTTGHDGHGSHGPGGHGHGGHGHGGHGGLGPAGRHRDRRLSEHLAELGHARARELGWTDVYTLSKALGERVAEDLGATGPLTIVRPTIIESALQRPYPGWVDGFKVADPLFAAYAKGRLPGFPGRPESVVDIIPVDLVVNAMLAAARRPPRPGAPRYLTVGTSVSNPLRLDDLRELAQTYFAEHPWHEADGTPVRPPRWRFVDPHTMAERLARTSRRLKRVRSMADRAPGRSGQRLRSRLAVASRRLASTAKFVQLYQPYTCSLTRYDDALLRELDRDRPEAERRSEPLDVTTWVWRDYWRDVHLPALSRLMLAAAGRPARPAGEEAAGEEPAAVDGDDASAIDVTAVTVVSPRDRTEGALTR